MKESMSKPQRSHEQTFMNFEELNHDLRKVIMQRVEAKVKALLQMARHQWGESAGAPIRVTYKLTGTKGGTASRKEPVINFNWVLLKENTDRFIETTVPHEVAHIVVCRLYKKGCRPHGREWKMVMRLFGITDPKRCHSYDTANCLRRKRTAYIYSCKCGKEFSLGVIRHRKLEKGVKYTCKVCRTALVFTGKVIG